MGVNRQYALSKGYRVFQCSDYGEELKATTASGGTIEFKEYIKLDMRIKGKMTEVRFYVMEGLPRPFLIGFPWMCRHGGVIDAQGGSLMVKGMSLTVELERQSREEGNQGFFAAFGHVQPVCNIGEAWGRVTIPKVELAVVSTKAAVDGHGSGCSHTLF